MFYLSGSKERIVGGFFKERKTSISREKKKKLLLMFSVNIDHRDVLV